MKLNSLWNYKSALRISSFNSQIKYVSTELLKPQIQYEKEPSQSSSQNYTHSRKKNLFSPELPRKQLENLANVTSIVVALNHVSWAKISLPDVTILNWNAYTLPDEFLEDLTETEILETAHILKKKIPESDLYVMESRSRRWSRCPNDICLRSMLVLLLSPLQEGAKDPKIVFQKPSVINTVHSLLIGGERISTRKILEKKSYLKFSEETEEKLINSTDYDSLKNKEDEQLHRLSSYSKAKQESLSTALLLALTFIDVAVFQKPPSFSKINKKYHHRTPNYPT